MIFNINLLEVQKIIVLVFILQSFIFVVKTILASGSLCSEWKKQQIKKEVEKLLAQGKISDAKKLARKYGVFRK